MPRAKATPAATAVVAPAPTAPSASAPKAPRRKAAAATAPAVVSEPAPTASASAPSAKTRTEKQKRGFDLVVESVSAQNGSPAFDVASYTATDAASAGGKKKRVYLHFTGHGPLQAAKKAFTQIRKFVNVDKCSYRFSVADKNKKATEYTFSCSPRVFANDEERKKHTIVKVNKKTGEKTDFVDRWNITYVSSNPRKRGSGASTSSASAPVETAPAPPAPAPVEAAPAKTGGRRKAAAK